jgi:arylsulfatase A-like enzyme
MIIDRSLITLFYLLFVKFLISQNSPENPNFIFILADDQGWNGTSVEMISGLKESKSDFYETPNIEKLAKKGVKFSYAYSSAPVCAPSRYSIQFGQSPARLKMIRVGMNTNHIDHSSDFTIPKQLKKINPNYKTAHYGKWGMDSNPKILGYDKSDGATKNKQGGFNYDSNKLQWSNNFDEDPKKIFSITQRAIHFITKNHKNKNPFFLQISHYAIHSNLIMRKETFEKYNNKKAGEIHDNLGLASMTEDLDTSVGYILDKLKELGIDKNTYVIYSSDNGSVPIIMPRKNYKKGYNYPLKRGKWDATEGGIRVPFIVSGPHIKPNSQAETPISFSDLLPTIIDLAGGKENLKNEKFDGGSFKQVLFNKSKKIKRNFNGIVFHVPYENKIALERAHSAIIVDKMKLIKFYDNNEIKLYNLKNDINENENLVFKRKKIAHNLELKLSNYLFDVKAPKWKPGITWKWKTLELINSYH